MNWLMRTILATGAGAAAAAGGSSGGAAADPLAHYRWEARPVLVFAAGGDARLDEQLRRFAADKAAMRDRDIVLVEVSGRSARVDEGPLRDAGSLRRRFGIAEDGFAVILVGKDGSEKRRVAEVIDPHAFYELIDTMPMRQDEMRRED